MVSWYVIQYNYNNEPPTSYRYLLRPLHYPIRSRELTAAWLSGLWRSKVAQETSVSLLRLSHPSMELTRARD